MNVIVAALVAAGLVWWLHTRVYFRLQGPAECRPQQEA